MKRTYISRSEEAQLYEIMKPILQRDGVYTVYVGGYSDDKVLESLRAASFHAG